MSGPGEALTHRADSSRTIAPASRSLHRTRHSRMLNPAAREVPWAWAIHESLLAASSFRMGRPTARQNNTKNLRGLNTMIVEMRKGAEKAEVDQVVAKARGLGFDVQINYGTEKSVVAILGSDTGSVPTDFFALLPGVESVQRIMKPYKLASREFKPDTTVATVAGIQIGRA